MKYFLFFLYGNKNVTENGYDQVGWDGIVFQYEI